MTNSEWFENDMEIKEFEVNGKLYRMLNIWSRKSTKYFETIVLFKDIKEDKYIIKYAGDTYSFSIGKIMKNWRDISFDFKRFTIHYTQNKQLNLDFNKGKQIGSEFDTYNEAMKKVNTYMSSS